MSSAEAPAEIDPSVPFEKEASAAGLVLPTRRPFKPWLAVGIVVVILGAAVGVGDLTGWAIGPQPHAAIGVYGPDACAHAPSYLSVRISTAVSSAASLGLASALADWGSEYSNWSGDCVHLASSVSAGDGYVPELSAKSVELVATDLAPNASERTALSLAVTLIPEAAVPVEVAYDLRDGGAPLRLDGSILAGMYNGTITTWDNPQISALNPTVDLAGLPSVTVLHRSGAAGVNTAFSSYLAQASPAWASAVGSGPSVAWPVGTGAINGSWLAYDLATTPGAIGYFAATGPVPGNSTVAELENPAGTFCAPSAAGATAAVRAVENSTAATNRAWSNLSLVDAPGAQSYPITEFAYFALYHDLGKAYAGAVSPTNATWVLSFLWWLVGNGSANLRALGFGAFPAPIVKLVDLSLETVEYNGGVILDSEAGESGGETGEF